MNLSSILIIFGITFITGVISFQLASKLGSWIKYLLSFSGAYLFGLTITHLLPEMYEKSAEFPLIPVLILGGFFFQLVLEQFSEGVEHGHIHLHDSSKFPFMLMVALMIHATLEGALLHEHGGHHDGHAANYLFGLTIHKIPIAVVLAILLKNYLKKVVYVIMLLALFSLATPLGTFLTGLFDEQFETILMALVAGSFLHISTTILFESSPNHKFNLIKFVVALAGAGASFLI